MVEYQDVEEAESEGKKRSICQIKKEIHKVEKLEESLHTMHWTQLDWYWGSCVAKEGMGESEK